MKNFGFPEIDGDECADSSASSQGATIIAFPRIAVPRPPRDLSLPAPWPGSRGALITSCGEYATLPESWDQATRLIVILAPEFDRDGKVIQPVDKGAIHQALENFARNLARLAYGPTAAFLKMIAALEECGADASTYTVFLRVPSHVKLCDVENCALDAFEDLVDGNDDVPNISVTEVYPVSTEILHLMIRTFPAQEDS
jgi:hypothetical protein